MKKPSGNPEKNPRGTSIIWHLAGIEPGPHWLETSALTTAPSLHPKLKFIFIQLEFWDTSKSGRKCHNFGLKAAFYGSFSCQSLILVFFFFWRETGDRLCEFLYMKLLSCCHCEPYSFYFLLLLFSLPPGQKDGTIVPREPQGGEVVTWTGDGFTEIKDRSALEYAVTNVPYTGEYNILVRYEPKVQYIVDKSLKLHCISIL